RRMSRAISKAAATSSSAEGSSWTTSGAASTAPPLVAAEDLGDAGCCGLSGAVLSRSIPPTQAGGPLPEVPRNGPPRLPQPRTPSPPRLPHARLAGRARARPGRGVGVVAPVPAPGGFGPRQAQVRLPRRPAVRQRTDPPGPLPQQDPQGPGSE